MSLSINALLGNVYVDEQPAFPGQFVAFENCVSVGDNSSVSIYDGTALAATLARSGTVGDAAKASFFAMRGNANCSLRTYSPPVTDVNPIYYRRSYRTQIRSPGGSVGIRV